MQQTLQRRNAGYSGGRGYSQLKTQDLKHSFLLQVNEKYYMEVVQVVVKVMPCLLTHSDTWVIHHLVDYY